MRITDSLRVATLTNNIETSLTNLNTVQQQISTGKKLNLPSDNPAGTSQSLADRAALVDNNQYQNDVTSATAFLKSSSSALSDATSLLDQARQIAVQGANSTQTPASWTSLSNQVNSLIQQMTNIANQKVGSKYLFSGTQTETAPYLTSDPTHAYQGDTGAITATIGPNNALTLNLPGSAVFGGTFSALETLKSDLSAGNITAISSDITSMDTSLNTISAAGAVLGAKTQQVQSVQQQLTRAQSDYQQAVANVEDTDLAQAYVQLQNAQNVYQASLDSTAKAYQYSLANYL